MAKRKTAKQIQEVQLPQVDVLKTNTTKGMPEAGASVGYNSCSMVKAL
ncbi:MAG: hypothetical protein JWN15_4023 [Firmicutes bacterium]|nr:hypothetical protein [Bacillota bacterium]